MLREIRRILPPMPPDLPTPLAKDLAARIEAGGPISVHDYMEACLYDPRHGYYRKASPLGRGGDFITAPEIIQVFGELIGLWAAEVWRGMGEPKPVAPDRAWAGARLSHGGRIARASRAAALSRSRLRASRRNVRAVEGSPEGRARLGPVPIAWHDGHRGRARRRGHRRSRTSSSIACRCGNSCSTPRRAAGASAWLLRGGRFPVRGRRRSRAGRSSPPRTPPRTAPSRTASRRRRLIHAFAARAPLAALIIDYGYSRPSLGDTLQAVRKHRFAGLFDAPGESDLTAHVDFAGLGQAAAEAGLKAFGPMPMGEWLLRLGLEARAGQLLDPRLGGRSRRSDKPRPAACGPGADGRAVQGSCADRWRDRAAAPIFLTNAKGAETWTTRRS